MRYIVLATAVALAGNATLQAQDSLSARTPISIGKSHPVLPLINWGSGRE
jgi:hypothetical protein